MVSCSEESVDPKIDTNYRLETKLSIVDHTTGGFNFHLLEFEILSDVKIESVDYNWEALKNGDNTSGGGSFQYGERMANALSKDYSWENLHLEYVIVDEHDNTTVSKFLSLDYELFNVTY